MKELIGKTITGLRVSAGERFLVFDHPEGTETVYEGYGDCCSESWFADITGVKALIGATVTGVETVEMGSMHGSDPRSRQEYDTLYGVKITTNKGYADIVMRNSSNGYYGGSIEHVLGVDDDTDMVAVSDDWSA